MMTSFPKRRVWLVACALTAGLLLAPRTLSAQDLQWDDGGSSFATFGPNASVTISMGFGVPGTCDFIFPATNIYVVNVSSIGDGAQLTDVSNGDGIPNTVQLAGGGIFIDETIGFTQPDGFLGPGVYGVVFDECQNGKFDAGVDSFFYPAFEVVIPANIDDLPPSSIGAIKAQAHTEGDRWAQLMQQVNLVEALMKIKDTIECLSGGIGGCLVSMAIDKFKEFMIEAAMGALGLVDPKEAAKDAVIDTIAHYGGIAADPPDPAFEQLDLLEPVAVIPATSTDPIINAFIGVGNAQATQAATLQAMLHAMERYQGADQAGNSEWALVHARAIQSLSGMLIDQIGASNTALTDLDTALTLDPRDFDAASAAAAPLIAQIVNSGFNAEQMQALLNAGATSQQINDLRASIAAEPNGAFTEAGMHAGIAAVLAENANLVTALTALATDMDANIVTLLSPPNLPARHPVALAGGPYSAAEGTAITLDAGASTDPDDAIVSYAWDLDRDGQFDDAAGASPSVTFAAAFTGFVAVKVTDAAGHEGVAYALATISDANHAPQIVSATPADESLSVPVGTNQAFSVAASDPDGDSLTARWTLDFVEVANGPLSHTIALNSVGQHTVRAEVTDGLPSGGSVVQQWTVTVLAADADGDGWNSNVDCDDGNASIHPYGVEIIGNGIDDDCRADTLDTGTPPTAAFTAPAGAVAVGTPVAFTNASFDPDSPVLINAWSFGDGGTSTEQHPTHTFMAAGTYTVTLSVTDPEMFTSTVSHTVTVTHLPVAGFTFAPNPGARTIPVMFTSTSSDSDGPLASYQWSFGDGGVSTDPNPSHIFDTIGTFQVQLTVTDGDGATASFAQEVTINPGPTDVTQVKFVMRETNCGTGANYRFTVGGVQVASFTPSYDCDCNAGLKTVTTTDPAVLAMVSTPVCQVFGIEGSNVYWFGYAYVELTRPSGVQRVRITNPNPNDGPDVYSGNSCGVIYYNNAASYQSALPNIDGDATPDCTDPDIDGDGIANVSDNCPITVNPSQADFDGDTVGDACEDSDGDTVLDVADNCPSNANTNQWDFDNDGLGNACDPDIDADGVLNAADNCAYISNADQADSNGDGHGDVCDIESMRYVIERSNQNYPTSLVFKINGTTVGSLPPMPASTSANCSAAPDVLTIADPEVLALLGTVTSCNAFSITADNYVLASWSKAEMVHYGGTVDTVVIHDLTNGSFPQSACYRWDYKPTYQNPTPDTDLDGIFDCKDPDLDADGVLNGADNCPYVPNTSQSDVDSNGIGDACQDTDADTVLDINDNCPLVANTNQANIDGDSMGDVCDPDRDNDTVLNAADNCPNNANTDQADLDGDGTGDVCDADMDGDTVPNGGDNCATTPNTDQRNTDGDSMGDACDPDKDNDGVLNAADNCEVRVNSGQEATNPFGVGDACVPIPITVPWLGVPTQPHQVYSGGKLVLQGVAIYDGDYAPAELTAAEWDPGDGSAPVSISVANGYALELEHTYVGAPGTPYFARLTIHFGNNQTRSDEFRVLIQPKTLDVEANMAIDRGLWNLHKSQTRYVVSGQQASYWSAGSDGDGMAATGSTLNAFGINNHRDNGDRLEDPYVEDVRRGFVHLEAKLNQANIGSQPAGDPDTNGNGIALYAGNQIYQSGQVAEAFIAAGQQTSVAVAGPANGRTFRDIVQDIMDGYWFGQVDPGNWGRGGWHYGWNYGSADNSTAQWGAITGLAGENAWNIPVPQWVKDENRDNWMRYSQNYGVGGMWEGAFGYGGTGCAWSNCMATTPSGMVQLIFDGVRNDPGATSEFELRYQAGKKFIAKGMRSGYHMSDPSFGGTNYYSLFAMAKAFRLAVDDNGSGTLVPDPVTLIDDDPADGLPAFDWYRSDPGPGDTAPVGVARLLISRQLSGGNWPDSPYWNGSLATAYSVIILSPTIFELGPAAMCTATPTIVAAGNVVNFDGSGSVHNDPFGTIESYSWDFQDGSAVVTNAAPTATATHAFSSLGTFNVLLTVTDQNGITASASCPVQVIDGNLPPTAIPGGPYDFCVGAPMVLDASGSADPEGGPLTFEWDLALPLNFSPVDSTAATFDAASALASFVPGTYQIALRVNDDHGHSTSVFPNITIHPAGDVAFCNTPPELTVPADITTFATSSSGAEVPFTATANDAQDGALMPSCAPPSGSLFPIGATTVSCSATDAGGLTVTKTFTVTVMNNPPAFAPPADITTPATSAAGAEVTFSATGNDVEDGSIAAVCAPASGSTFPIGATTVNCSVTDTGGASANGSFTVTVTNNGPSFTPPADITTPATSAAGAAVAFAANGTDLEDGAIAAVCAPSSGSTFAIGTTPVNCTVTDSGGLTASGSFTVTVTNNAPAFTPPADITRPATSPAGASVGFAATGQDVEDGVIVAHCTPVSDSTFPIGTTTVNCTVTDTGGLTASGSFTVTVTNNAPTFTPPANITTAATSAAGAAVSFVAAGNDVEDGPIAAVCAPASGSTFPIGTTTVDCSVTDVAGATATGSFTVTVTNNAPTFTPPANITIAATSAAGAAVSFVAAGNDLEDGPIAAVCAPASGSTFPIGTTTVDCSVTDVAGATATGSFTVTVTNNAPTFTPPANITTAATSAAGAAVSFVAAGNDVEDGPIAAVCAPASGSTFPIGTTTVDCSATDVAGATATGSFTVTVTNNAPTFTPPANITIAATSAAGAAVSFVAAGNDVEDGAIAAVCAPASGSTFPIGTTTVDCSVTDVAGATATGSFTVTVTNNAPTFTPPANITTAATSAAGAAVSFVAAGNDVEDGAIAAVCAPASGSTFPIGTTTVDCSVTDVAGATATGSFTVTVTNNAPTFTPPANITTAATSAAGAAVSFVAAGNDVEDGAIAAVCAPASGSTFPIGTTTVMCTVTDSRGASVSGSFTVTVTNNPPVCSATPSIPEIWPPNHKLVPITLGGITDVDGTFTVKVTLIAQDEPTNTVGDGNTSSDADGIGTATAWVRSERSGTPKVPGNGRVYHIFYAATDNAGASCTGKVLVGVPHDQGNKRTLIDDGPKFNSVTGAKLP